MGEDRAGCGILLLVMAFVLGAGVMYACGPHGQSATAACCRAPVGTPAQAVLAPSASPCPEVRPADAAACGLEAALEKTAGVGPGLSAVKLGNGQVLIVGGYGDGQDATAYEGAAGRDGVTINATAGFVSIVPQTQARAVFCNKLREAIAKGQALQPIMPLLEWGQNPCGL